MTGVQHQLLTAASSAKADLGELLSFNSPPCFLHELDPSYLGYLERGEVCELLLELLRAKLAGTRVENAWAHAMLLRQAARLDDRRTSTSSGSSAVAEPEGAGASEPLSPSEQECLGAKLEVALPRLHDEGLRQDLEQVLRLLKRDRLNGERRSDS